MRSLGLRPLAKVVTYNALNRLSVLSVTTFWEFDGSSVQGHPPRVMTAPVFLGDGAIVTSDQHGTAVPDDAELSADDASRCRRAGRARAASGRGSGPALAGLRRSCCGRANRGGADPATARSGGAR